MKRQYLVALILFVVFACACHHKEEIDDVLPNNIHFGNDYAAVLEKLSSDSTLIESGGNIYCYGQDPYSVVAYNFEYNNLYAITYVIPQKEESVVSVINQRLSGFTNLGLIKSLDTYYNEKEHCFAVVKNVSDNGQIYTAIAYTQYDPNNNNVIMPRIEITNVSYYNDSYIEISASVSGIDSSADCYIFYSLTEDFSSPTVFTQKNRAGNFTMRIPFTWAKNIYYFGCYIIYEDIRYDGNTYPWEITQ